MPWLTALRTRCSTGSIIRSTRNLSISVSWPLSTTLTERPLSRARSRTTNGMRRKISPTGTRRTRMTPSRRSRSWRSIDSASSSIARQCAAREMALGARERVGQPRAQDHQVADHPHQFVEARQVDAHVMAGGQDRAGPHLRILNRRRRGRRGIHGREDHAIGLPGRHLLGRQRFLGRRTEMPPRPAA